MINLYTLIEQIKASEDLQKQLSEAFKSSSLAMFLADQGCEATVEEFLSALNEQSAQLDDAALDTVAGGANGKEAIMSIFSLGICCIIEAINSSNSDVPKEEWGDGRIICTAS